MVGLDREVIVQRLVELFRGLSDVEVAILFGSAGRGCGGPRDVDVAVKFSVERSLLDLAGLASLIARCLGVSEELVDVVDLSRVKPVVLLRILRDGVVLKGSLEALKGLYEEASRGIDQLMEVERWASLDPEPRVDRVVIASRVEEVRRNTAFLKEEILARSVEELTYKDVLALERAVHRVVEAMLDICRHLVAVHSLGLVESYGEYPRRLAEAGIMPRELAEELAKFAGLRNILVHRYLDVDLRRLHEAARRMVEEVTPKFLGWVTGYLA